MKIAYFHRFIMSNRRQGLESTFAPSDNIEETLAAGSSALPYDAAADLYTYGWKVRESMGQQLPSPDPDVQRREFLLGAVSIHR
jgi:hypothetical protein